jgi:hypothetical protein
MMSTLDELAQRQIFGAEMFYLSQTHPTETFTWTVIADNAAGKVYVWQLEWDRAVRGELYNMMEHKLRRHRIVRYSVASECWIGGGDAPDREEGFIVVCADRDNNRLAYHFKLRRDAAGRAIMLPDPANPQAGLTGDLYTVLGFHTRDAKIVKSAA